MCIAVYKPSGIKMPSKKTFSNCFNSNSDGAGFMFPYDGKVHYEKGFMSFSSFKKGLKSAVKKYGIDTKDTPMVFHFRIQSQGGVKPSLTHPFPLTSSYDKMRELTGDYKVACVHNGIIDFASSYKAVDYSDTMEFISEVLKPLLYKNETKYYKNKSLMGIINYLLAGNRFAIMDYTGHVELIGNWIEDKGVFYSNTSYMSKSSLFTSTGKLTEKWYREFYDDYDTYYGYDYDDYLDGFYKTGFITKAQEDEFLKTGMLMCECGEEMVIEYVKSEARVYAFCCQCGLAYKLSSKAEEYAWDNGLVYCSPDDDDLEVADYNKSYGVGGSN